jgi:hypothetical protein
MISITIDEKFESEDDMAIALRIIAKLLTEGYESGYDPSWGIVDEEENTP